jgi:hypothetical protein
MKVSTGLFSLLLVSQVLPWAIPPVHAQAQTADAQAVQREDASDGRQLQSDYDTAYRYSGSTIPAHSVEEVTERIKTLPDGNQIKSRQSGMRYRDANGRVRFSYKTLDGKERIFIADPNVRTAWLIRPNRNDILRITGLPAYRYGNMARQTKASPWSRMVTTTLGVKEIAGVKAAGTLRETFYPAGAQGNEKDMVETSESWRSEELAATVYSRRVSPRMEESITRYDNLKLGDVPESMFAVPAGLAIRDIVIDTMKAPE